MSSAAKEIVEAALKLDPQGRAELVPAEQVFAEIEGSLRTQRGGK